MKIGQAPASARAVALQSRPRGFSSPGPAYAGSDNLGPSIIRGGAALAAGIGSLAEERERNDTLEGMKAYRQTIGELRRWQQEAAAAAPANGAGFTDTASAEWDKRFGKFLTSVPEYLFDRFAAEGEAVRQDFLMASEELERGLLRGSSIRTIEESLREASAGILADPTSREAWEQQLGAAIAAAPGLTPTDREESALRAVQSLDGVYVESRLYHGARRRTVYPDSPEFAQLVGAVKQVESAGNPAALGAAGEAGSMQVMPGTAREIARELNDATFPHGGDDAAVQNFLVVNGERYGEYYLRKWLRHYGGDVEAALIAYNAGKSRADAFIRAGRDYSVIPESTARVYVPKVMRELGALTQEEIQGLRLSPEATLAAMRGIEGQGAAAGEAGAAEMTAQFTAAVRRAASAVALSPNSYEFELPKLIALAEEVGRTPAEVEALKAQVADALTRASAGNDPSFTVERIAQGTQVTPETIAMIRERTETRLAKETAEKERAYKARTAEIYEGFLALVDEGVAGFSGLDRMVESGVIGAGSPEYFRAKNAIEERDKGLIALAETRQDLLNPDFRFTGTEKDRNRLGDYASALGIPSRLEEKDDAAALDVLRLWNETGVAPSSVKAQLNTMIERARPEDFLFAYKLLNDMRATNDGGFAREFGDDALDKVNAYDWMVRSQFSQDEITQLLGMRRTQQDMTYIRQLEEDANTSLKENYTAGDLTKHFSSWLSILPGQPRATFGESVEQRALAGMMDQDYRKAYRLLYPLYQDHGKTEEAVFSRLERLYGTMSDGTIVKYPPERYVPPFNGGHEWVEEQFRRELNVQEGDVVRWRYPGENVDRAVSQGMTPFYNYAIVRKGGLTEAGFWQPDIAAERARTEQMTRVLGVSPAAGAAELARYERQHKDLVDLVREYVASDDEAYKTSLRTFIADKERMIPSAQRPQLRGDGNSFFTRLLDDILGNRPIAPEFMEILRRASPGRN